MKRFGASVALAGSALACALALATPAAVRGQLDPQRAIERAELARTLDPELARALDGPPPLAARAALAIGRTKRPAGAPPLRAHLGAPAAGVRAMCAYGLGLLGDAASLADLMALARGDRSSSVRYAAIDAVGRIVAADPARASYALATDALIVLRADADPFVRAHAAAQFDAFRGVSFARTIVAALERAQDRERDQTVRWHIAWAIFRGYATVADAAFLRRELHDRNDLVRVEAARAWGRRSDPDAAATVRAALGDPSWRVQLEAGEALRRIAHRAPTDHLIVDPPGLHLPKIPPVSPQVAALALRSRATPTPAASPATSAAPSPGTGLAAPDAARFDLAPPVFAESAVDLATLDARPHPRVRIATTKGDVVLRLAPEWAPSTVANFLALAAHGYFDGNRWFRIVPDFVVQTGDPTDNGEGDAGYAIPAEENPLEEGSGIVAMGLNYAGDRALRDSAGTQFYLTLSPQLHLDRDFSVFGEVQRGFDVLAHLLENDRIVTVARISDG